MFVFGSAATTGEVKPVYSGLDASLLLILLAKYTLPFLVREKRLVSEGDLVQHTELIPNKDY